MPGKAVVGAVLQAFKGPCTKVNTVSPLGKLGLLWRAAELPTSKRTAEVRGRTAALPQPHSGVLVGARGRGGDDGDQCELDDAQTSVLELEKWLGVVLPGHGGNLPGRTPPPPRDAGQAMAAKAPRSGDDGATSSSRTWCRDVRQLETRGSMAMQRPRPFPEFTSDRQELVSPSHRPSRIILIRHGESLGNVSELVYTEQPDWKIPLSENGIQQSYEAGRQLREIIGSTHAVIYHSPYARAVQSTQYMLHALDADQVVVVREEPRVAEQQFGNLQDLETIWRSKVERRKYGRFFYRFPDGEAGLDVYSRISSFIGTLRRDHVGSVPHDVVIVTHGLALRLFLMRWFQWTVEQFESTYNPPNGGLAVMVRQSDGRYKLTHATLAMVGATRAPTTSIIGRAMLRRAYVDAFLSY